MCSTVMLFDLRRLKFRFLNNHLANFTENKKKDAQVSLAFKYSSANSLIKFTELIVIKMKLKVFLFELA